MVCIPFLRHSSRKFWMVSNHWLPSCSHNANRSSFCVLLSPTPVQNRASGIPICYLKPPYYPMASSNPNELVYQNSLAQRAQLSNQQMLLINPNFNPNTPPTLSNFNRPTNSILPAPAQAIGMTSSQRFSNPSNYPYPVNGSTSHLEMNQMYPHVSVKRFVGSQRLSRSIRCVDR